MRKQYKILKLRQKTVGVSVEMDSTGKWSEHCYDTEEEAVSAITEMVEENPWHHYMVVTVYGKDKKQ